MKKKTYEQKATTFSIKFTSRASVKVGDSFYTVEACEERLIPLDIDGIDVDQEKKLLWDAVNTECDTQIEDILKTYKK